QLAGAPPGAGFGAGAHPRAVPGPAAVHRVGPAVDRAEPGLRAGLSEADRPAVRRHRLLRLPVLLTLLLQGGGRPATAAARLDVARGLGPRLLAGIPGAGGRVGGRA